MSEPSHVLSAAATPLSTRTRRSRARVPTRSAKDCSARGGKTSGQSCWCGRTRRRRPSFCLRSSRSCAGMVGRPTFGPHAGRRRALSHRIASRRVSVRRGPLVKQKEEPCDAIRFCSGDYDGAAARLTKLTQDELQRHESQVRVHFVAANDALPNTDAERPFNACRLRSRPPWCTHLITAAEAPRGRSARLCHSLCSLRSVFSIWS